MRRKFHTLDVFTDKALTGNPLAVVLDCEGLDPMRMQSIAREFNLSETVFVLPPRDAVNTARVRIFTPGHELPFAGHPTIGTAVLLAELRAPEILINQDVGIVLEENVGEISCTVRHLRGHAPRASFTLPSLPQHSGALGPADAIAAALGVEVERIGFREHRPARFSAGLSFAFVPLADRGTIARLKLDLSHWQKAFGGDGIEPVFVYCPDPVDRSRNYHARMFAPRMGFSEDPATGSAVAALAALVMAFEKPRDGGHTILVEQGFEMGRPSVITLGLEVSDGVLVSASIAGSAVMIAQGVIDV